MPLSASALRAGLLGAVLFVCAAAPLLVVRQPPFQDFAEHLAAAAMASRSDAYPEYVFNGFLKTNSAFVTFTCLAGKACGLRLAARLFVLLVLAASAFALPWFVLHFGGRARMTTAALFAPPFVHNWFVSMGMLNFALGVALSMVLLVELDRQRVSPGAWRAARVAAVSLVTWFVHPVPVMVVGLLVLAFVVTRRGWAGRASSARVLLPALVPVGLLLAASTLVHLRGTAPATGGEATSFQTLPWLVYDLWAHWWGGYTPLSAVGLVPAIVLAVLAASSWRRAPGDPPLFGAPASLVLLGLYFAAPYQTVGLGYAGSRILPFVWLAALVRVPERLPRGLAALVGAASVFYVAAMAIDTVRLAGDEDEVAAGVSAVPAGARLDVFLFSTRLTSKNTWSLATAWGEYVVDAGAHTWEMPGDTPSLPFRWRGPPPGRLETSAHHRFMDAVATRGGFCARREGLGLDAASCDAAWRAEWAGYYREVDPYVDAIVMWDPPQDSLDQVPQNWRPSLHQGRLWIFARK
jgi:hypothetical protein